MVDCSAISIGKRITKCRKEYAKKHSKRFSQEQFAKTIGCSREQVAKFEIGKQTPDPQQFYNMAQLFGVSVGYLAVGTDDSNQIVSADTGLNNDAIESLKILNNKNDSSFSQLDIGNKRNHVILDTLNRLISTSDGQALLYQLGLFFDCDFSHGFNIEDETAEVEWIMFRSRVHNDPVQIPVEMMRYAMMKGIQSSIEDIAYEMASESESKKGTI